MQHMQHGQTLTCHTDLNGSWRMSHSGRPVEHHTKRQSCKEDSLNTMGRGKRASQNISSPQYYCVETSVAPQQHGVDKEIPKERQKGIRVRCPKLTNLSLLPTEPDILTRFHILDTPVVFAFELLAPRHFGHVIGMTNGISLNTYTLKSFACSGESDSIIIHRESPCPSILGVNY